MGLEPSEPVGANKLPVGYQAVDLVTPNYLKELPQQLDSLLGTGVTPFGHDTKEKRKGDAVVDDGQDEEVDGHPSKHPLGSIESQGVGCVG